MKNLDEGPDGLDDAAFDRAWDRAIHEDAARRAAVLPARGVRPPESLEEFRVRIAAELDAHFNKFAPVISAINAGFAATGGRKP